MLSASHFLGLVAEKLEAMPGTRRFLAKSYARLGRLSSAVGVGLPRQMPVGLRQLKKLYKSRTPMLSRPVNGVVILVMSPRAWATHLLVDTLLAESLKLRGAEIVVWTCGRSMPICHITNANEAPPMPCAGCQRQQGDILGSSSLRHITTAEAISRANLASLKSGIEKMGREEVLNYVSEGVPFGRIVRDAYSWFYLTVDIPQDEYAVRRLREFLLLAETTKSAAQMILDQFKPDMVIMANGVFTEESVVRALCEKSNTSYLTYERAFGFNQFVFSRNQVANHYDLSKHWPECRDVPLSKEQVVELEEFLRGWRRGDGAVVAYWDSPEERVQVIRESVGANPDARIVTMFTNVVWDTAMFGRNACFDDMWDWISTTIGIVENRQDIHLVVRIHPAEIKLEGRETRDRIIDRIRNEFPALPRNVTIIQPDDIISSYKLLSMSDTVLVYTSTIGLEAAIEGNVVIVCGETHYRGKGFTCDPASKYEYQRMLCMHSADLSDPENTCALAKRYAYLFFLRHMFRLPIIEEQIMGNPRLNIGSLEELLPGNDGALDYLCDFILDNIASQESEALITPG